MLQSLFASVELREHRFELSIEDRETVVVVPETNEIFSNILAINFDPDLDRFQMVPHLFHEHCQVFETG